MTEIDKRSPVFDWGTMEFVQGPSGEVLTATGGPAAKQVILKALNTARGKHLIYADVDNPERNHKYGNDAPQVLQAQLPKATRNSELMRTLTEAIKYDPWIQKVTVSGITPGSKSDELVADLNVTTIFDTMVVEGVEVIE